MLGFETYRSLIDKTATIFSLIVSYSCSIVLKISFHVMFDEPIYMVFQLPSMCMCLNPQRKHVLDEVGMYHAHKLKVDHSSHIYV